MKVLIVDDSRAMRLIIKRALRQAGFGGFSCCEAASGAEALEVAARECPDLVLADWNLPETSGLELLEALRGAGNRVAFGFVTAERTEGVRTRAEEAGSAFMISKPFTPELFRATLAPVVRQLITREGRRG